MKLTRRATIKLSTKRILLAVSVFCLFLAFSFVVIINVSDRRDAKAASSGCNLNQARNGTDSISVNPMNWVNGNIGTGTAHYVEAWSAPYQCLMTGLSAGVQVTLTIGYDIRNSSHNGIDFLTHYNRISPHSYFTYHSVAETIDPLSGTGLSSGTAYNTYTIPAPSSTGSTVAGEPTASYNALTAGERLMTIYNGTIDSIYYVSQGSLTSSSAETQVAIKFTPSASTVVLLWGGHIASRTVWGFTNGSPNSAGGISGSPFHMRLISWTLGNLGSTDRSISGASVYSVSALLPVELSYFSASAEEKDILTEWATASEINNDYFTIERSADGQTFLPIHTLHGAGNSTSMLHYSAKDESPLPGINYYRLKQTDYDGKFTYSDVKAVNFKKTKTEVPLAITSIGPNPFTNYFNLKYSAADAGTARLTMINASGDIIKMAALNAEKGLNSYSFVQQTALAPGIYYVSIMLNGKLVSQKVVKNS